MTSPPASRFALTEDPSRLSFGLGLKAWRDSFVLRGRSTRTEFFSFWLATVPVGLAIGLILALLDMTLSIRLTDLFDPRPQNIILDLVLHSIPVLPVFALMARRAHDAGWYGAPIALVVLATFAAGQWENLHYRFIGFDWPPVWVQVIHSAGVLIVLATLLWAPTRGANRFGPDPRGSDH